MQQATVPLVHAKRAIVFVAILVIDADDHREAVDVGNLAAMSRPARRLTGNRNGGTSGFTTLHERLGQLRSRSGSLRHSPGRCPPESRRAPPRSRLRLAYLVGADDVHLVPRPARLPARSDSACCTDRARHLALDVVAAVEQPAGERTPDITGVNETRRSASRSSIDPGTVVVVVVFSFEAVQAGKAQHQTDDHRNAHPTHWASECLSKA